MMTASAFLIAAAAICAEKAIVSSDDFSDAIKSATHWKLSGKNVAVKDGVLSFNHGGTAQFKGNVPDNFTLSFDLAIPEPEKGKKVLGFSGLDINGIKFMIRNDGLYWGIYRLPGEKTSRGNAGKIFGFKFGKLDKVTVVSKKIEKGFKYTCKVNDKQIISFEYPGNEKRKLIFMAYKTKAVFDNFKLKPEE